MIQNSKPLVNLRDFQRFRNKLHEYHEAECKRRKI